MTKLNKILIAMAAVQLALAIFVMTRGSDTAASKPQPVLAGFDAAQVTRLQVFEAGADKGVDLAKRGSDWVLTSAWDYPVDATKVDAALTPLAKLVAGEPIATSATRHKQLRVGDKDFDKKLVITAGGRDLTLFVGGTKGRNTALRLGGQDQVLSAAGVPTGALSSVARDWVAGSYSEIPRDDIDKIEIVRGATKIELDRTAAAPPAAGSGSDAGSGSGSAAPGPRTWRVAIDGAPVALAAGETIDTYAIETIVSAVSEIPADPADPKRDAGTPAATVTVTRRDGKAVTFDLVESGVYYWVTQRGLGRATQVDKARLESLITAARGTLVKKPDPAPAGAGSGSGARSPLPPGPIVPPPGLE